MWTTQYCKLLVKRHSMRMPLSKHLEMFLFAKDDGSVEYALQKVRHYLVAATAKDCSIMISIKPQQTLLEASRLACKTVNLSFVD